MNPSSNTLLLLLSLVTSTPLIQAQDNIASIYTDLASSKCKTIKVDKETGSSIQSCPGIAGYKLLVADDDARQSITVVTPGGKKSDLDIWSVITHAFSSIGNKAEWRTVKKNGKVSPIALIVRVNANEDSGNPNRVTSYLAVAKITPEKICVTHKIAPGAKANEDARHAADASHSAECLKDVAP